MTQRVLPMAAGLCAALICGPPSAARAQTDSIARRSGELSVAIGVGQRRQRDVTASPLIFAGTGGDAAARIDQPVGQRLTVTAGLDATWQRMTTASTPARERIVDGNLHAALLQTVAGRERTATGAIALGVDAGVGIVSNVHRYATPTTPTGTFLLVAASVGPAVQWHALIARGAATVELHAPLVGLVDHPYSEAKAGYTPVAIHAVDARSFRALDALVRFAPEAARRMGITADYRASLLRFDDVQPLHAVSQAFSIGIATRFGGRAVIR
jgi:hypothetical protein